MSLPSLVGLPMRRFCFPLALLMLATSSGCTLTFGVYGATQDAQHNALEERAPTAEWRDGQRVVLLLRDGRRRPGVWRGLATLDGDTARVVLIESTRLDDRGSLVRVRVRDIASVRPRHYESEAKGFLTGLLVDGVLVTWFLYQLLKSPAFRSSG